VRAGPEGLGDRMRAPLRELQRVDVVAGVYLKHRRQR
jgi:hypothetical protein